MDSWFSGKESQQKRIKGQEQRDRIGGMHLSPGKSLSLG